MDERDVAEIASSLIVVRARLRQIAWHLCLTDEPWPSDWSGHPLIYQLVAGPWYATSD